MSHLYKFRKGWQSEHLARYILSKFSFVAEPSTIADDLGSDFFCTFFDIINEHELLPRNSFAIQIKSNKKNIPITNKTSYLSELRIPFFIGIVDKNSHKLGIYSGECLSNFFAHEDWPHKTVEISLIGERKNDYPMYHKNKNKYFLKFPKILEVEAAFDYTRNQGQLNEFIKVCNFTQANITTRKNHEYIFKRYDSVWVDIFTGPGSATSFRKNFIERLAEVFYNLGWLYKNSREKSKIIAEFEMYKKLYLELKSLNDLPPYLVTCFDDLDRLINLKTK